MGIKNELAQQIRRILPGVFKVWILYIVFFSLVIGIGKMFFNISADRFTRDPNQIVNIPFYIGAISNLGIIFWSGTVALCIFSYLLLKRYKPLSPLKTFMLNAAVITSILLLDDLYMWHEEMFPIYLKIPEFLVYMGYSAYFLFFLVKFRSVILHTEYLILMAAFLFLGTSVLMDVMMDIKLFAKQLHLFYKHETLFEDFFKSIGILTWLIYFSRVSFSKVLPEVRDPALL